MRACARSRERKNTIKFCVGCESIHDKSNHTEGGLTNTPRYGCMHCDVIHYDLTCKCGSVGQSKGLLIPRLSV